MLGVLSGRLFVIGKEELTIKANEEEVKQGKSDSHYLKITLGDGGQNVFSITCGTKAWEVEVAPNKKVIFDPYALAFGCQYDMTFAVEPLPKGNKLRLRTWKDVGNFARPTTQEASKPEK